MDAIRKEIREQNSKKQSSQRRLTTARERHWRTARSARVDTCEETARSKKKRENRGRERVRQGKERKKASGAMKKGKREGRSKRQREIKEREAALNFKLLRDYYCQRHSTRPILEANYRFGLSQNWFAATSPQYKGHPRPTAHKGGRM